MRDTSSSGMRATLPGLCSWSWPMSLPTETRDTVILPGQVFLELLAVTVRLGACHSVLAEVVALAGEAPGLSDEQLRAALVVLADRAARRLEDEIR